jgi:hypothetical protein
MADSSIVVRKESTDILHEFQVAAPVKLGRFRAGWSSYLIHTGLHPLVEGPDAIAVAEGRALGKFQERLDNPNGPSISIVNGVHYGPDLEAGASGQADAGFHEAIIARHQANLAR